METRGQPTNLAATLAAILQEAGRPALRRALASDREDNLLARVEQVMRARIAVAPAAPVARIAVAAVARIAVAPAGAAIASGIGKLQAAEDPETLEPLEAVAVE